MYTIFLVKEEDLIPISAFLNKRLWNILDLIVGIDLLLSVFWGSKQKPL